MTYKFYYVTKGFELGLPFEVEAHDVHEALREFASYICNHGFKLDYVRAHYWVTNDKGRTSTRAFKPSLVKFVFDCIDDFNGLNIFNEAL